MSERLVEVKRAGLVESAHYGSIAVVDSMGRLLHSAGDADRMTFFHSSAKPFQAVVALEAGSVEAFGLDLKEVAIWMSSHSGLEEHIRIIRSIIGKLEIDETQVECGVAEPVDKEALKELYLHGSSPSNLHCNCSGKHLGFIAAAKMKGLPLKDYQRPEHPLQKLVLDVISDFSGTAASGIPLATDGCGVPVFALPLKNMAFAYANLCNPDFMEGKYKKSQNYIISAMTMYPEMVAGKGRLDTDLMRGFGSRVLGKAGAEGVYCLGILEQHLGVAIKIDDGAQRASGPAAVEALFQLGILRAEEARQLERYWKPELLNNKGEDVGQIVPVFSLV